MNSKKEDFSLKVQKWFRDNVSVFAIIIISVVYVLYGLITITETGKSAWEIIADGSISFLMGFLMKTLLNNQGLSNGERSEIFLRTKSFYSNLVDSLSANLHQLGNFCDAENEQMLIKAQKAILRTKLLKYEDFVENKFNYSKLNKEQKKAIYKASHIRLHYLSESILLSDCEFAIDVGKELSANKKTYKSKSNRNTIIIMLASALLFGWFSVDKNSGFNVAGAIWSLIQIAYYLGVGIIQYFQGYTFMTDTYKTALVRKCNYLEKFRNLLRENPDRFKDKTTIQELEKGEMQNEYKSDKKQVSSTSTK